VVVVLHLRLDKPPARFHNDAPKYALAKQASNKPSDSPANLNSAPKSFSPKPFTPTSSKTNRTPAILASAKQPHAVNNHLTDDLEFQAPPNRASEASTTATFSTRTAQAVVPSSLFSFPTLNPQLPAAPARGSATAQKLEPLPLFVYDDIYKPEHKVQNSASNSKHQDLTSDFWKKPELWGPNPQKATEQPFSAQQTVDDWLKHSCSTLPDASPNQYLNQQHAFSLVEDAGQRKTVLEAFSRIVSPSTSNTTKFYWLLLHFVYASSMLPDPTNSWWYQQSQGDLAAGSSKPPDNFCSVLQRIQKYPDVFKTYADFYDLFKYYCEGLKVWAKRLKEAKPEENQEQFKSIMERIDWVRSRPLLGVPNSKKGFASLLDTLKDTDKKNFADFQSVSKHLWMQVPGHVESKKVSVSTGGASLIMMSACWFMALSHVVTVAYVQCAARVVYAN
jgi:hypothetical protein